MRVRPEPLGEEVFEGNRAAPAAVHGHSGVRVARPCDR
jgi:hypothetical protein